MTRVYLPALRGLFGDWAYYSCLMTLGDLSSRVSFAADIHKSQALSGLIQRKLKDGRSRDIAEYLQKNRERFFNSLVVAVYGGDPAWHQLDKIRPQSDDLRAEDVSEDAVASMGFLSFNGGEKLFALDGQHRLAGIQEALEADGSLEDDEVSVIFVSHHNDDAGLMRTRRLFTTLNKTAKPVNKSEIIALDEADVMAIVVRDLVENHPFFSENRILIEANANLPAGNVTHLTTIVNLYDVMTILFSKVIGSKAVKELQYNRPPDSELERYKSFAADYFMRLSKAFPELREFFEADDAAAIVKKHRRPDGGSVLFRPVGLTLFANLIDECMRLGKMSMPAAFEKLSLLPTELSTDPYVNLLWDPSTKTMDLRRQALVRRLMLYKLGIIKSKKRIDKLTADVAKALGVPPLEVVLPSKVA